MNYTDQQFRELFQRQFGLDSWRETILNIFNPDSLLTSPENIEDDDERKGLYLGSTTTPDHYRLGFFVYQMQKPVERRKVGLRRLVKPYTRYMVDAALVVFADKERWRLSLISDIKGEETPPRRFTFVFGDSQNLYNTPVARFALLQSQDKTFANLREAFSVEALSKDFYSKLYQWYQWALDPATGVTFPNNPHTEADDRENIHVKLIRLITRMLFVWFIKQKHLVPDELFCAGKLKAILKDFSPTAADNGNYYNAILQNLFFATLNCAIADEDGSPRQFAMAKNARDTRNLYRYSEMFAISEKEVVEMFAKTPFLNGGLFECLDKPKTLYPDQPNDIFYDGFSRNATRAQGGNFKYRAFVPNILFFNDDESQPGLINLFAQYNFTMQENTPTDAEISLDPELLGRVFENLLAAYNPETQESARKATGSFYTPREIVDYMVDEALKAYLNAKHISGLSPEHINTLFATHTLPQTLAPQAAEEARRALLSIKMLDPACGSGAFPMGCLLRIVEMAELLAQRPADRYQLKLHIIENCIYGVDIQPIAMLICKLRFFISLICEQTDIDFSSPQNNYGVNTLPNLETKFVAANTLISADIKNYANDWTADETLRQMQAKLLDIRKNNLMAKTRKDKLKTQRDDRDMREKIKEHIMENTKPDQQRIAEWERQIAENEEKLQPLMKKVYVDATKPIQHTLFGPVEAEQGAIFRRDINEPERRRLQECISTAKALIEQEKRKAETPGFEAAVKQVTKWDPYDQNSESPFFDPEWMFGVKDGFDIVIGNPPYKEIKFLPEDMKTIYRHLYTTTGDMYCLFIELAKSFLRRNGIGAMITSNKWLRASYGNKLRNFMLDKYNVLKIIDLKSGVFESANVDTCVAFWRNSNDYEGTLCGHSIDDNNQIRFRLVPNSIWSFASTESNDIKLKVDQIKSKLTSFDVELHYGILTGSKDVFILTRAKAEHLISLDEKNKNIIKPLLTGKDIQRYYITYNDLYLLNLHNGIKKKRIKPIDIEDYPTILPYLDSFGEQFKNRGEQGSNWYNLRNCAYIDQFLNPKIIYSDIVQDRGKFYYDEDGYYTNESAFIIVGNNLKYLTAILNSYLFSYLYRQFYSGGGLGNKGLRYKKQFLLSVPIPKASDITRSDIENLVDEITLKKKASANSDTSSEEREIDRLVYRLYGLSYEDVLTVDPQTPITREEYQL